MPRLSRTSSDACIEIWRSEGRTVPRSRGATEGSALDCRRCENGVLMVLLSDSTTRGWEEETGWWAFRGAASASVLATVTSISRFYLYSRAEQSMTVNDRERSNKVVVIDSSNLKPAPRPLPRQPSPKPSRDIFCTVWRLHHFIRSLYHGRTSLRTSPDCLWIDYHTCCYHHRCCSS